MPRQLKTARKAIAAGARMGLMKHLTGKKLDAAYEYRTGTCRAGRVAFVSRYGYYSRCFDRQEVHDAANTPLVRGQPAPGL